jgi:hypothetical protein
MRARNPGLVWSAAPALVRRPDLWPVVFRLVPPGWWRRWPPRPWPAPDYLRFRAETMYGPAGGPLQPADLVAYLEWCRRMGRLAS